MNFRLLVKALIFCCLLLPNLSRVGLAQSVRLPDGVTKGASVEGVNEYRLPNGLQILLIPDSSTQNVTVNLVYRVGSRHEGYGETGMAHLLEHLLFKGTPKYPKIPDEISKRGMQANATTALDRTNYFGTFTPVGDNLEFYLDLEADRMLNAYIAKKDLDSEMTVVRNEMENGENNPTRVVMQKMMASAFDWHNYGKSTIGARSDVENVKIENLQAFYRKFYQPDNATLIVGGKIDETRTLQMIKDKFGVLAKPTRQLEPTWTADPPQDGEREVTVRRVGDEQIVAAGYRIPPSAHPDLAPIYILERVMADSSAGRLYKALVETKKATSALASTFQQKEPGFTFYMARVGKNDSIDEAQKILIDTVENFAKTTPAKEEVERQKTSIAKSLDTVTNDSNRMVSILTDFVAKGDWRLFFLYRDQLKKVTPEDVQRVAKTYLIQSNRTVARFIPTETPLRADIKRMTDEEIIATANGVKSGESVAKGEVFDATPANLEARIKRGQIGGLKTAFLTKETRGNIVTARVDLHFGDEKSLMNLSRVGSFSAQMLMRGTAKRTRQQLKDDIDRLKATISVDGGPTGVSASITATRENLAAALKIVEEILKEPAFPAEEFEQVKTAALTSLESGRSDPQAIATRELRLAFNKKKKGEIGYGGTLEEELEDTKAVTLDAVKKFYKDFFGASAGEAVIVGDFDEKEVSPFLTKIFGAWKSPKAYARIAQNYYEIPGKQKVIETPDKANAVYFARENFKMRDDNPDYPALLIGNYILGGGFLNSRLATRIRQKDGISYSVGSAFSAGSQDEIGSFLIQAIFAPENAARLDTAIREELSKIITEGFTEQELADAKQGWLLSRQTNRGNDGFIRATLSSYLNLDRTFAWDEAIEKKVQALTADQVNTAMKKYLAPDKFVVIKAGDFAKVKAKP